ncbi:M23 family metallopeptidase [Pelagibacterium montanilacus]|uniref:M23 family metallopeptidase n=1 Tax=Pelagibacterium montanilacus TaxID=2185280 RepID=UPI000F8C353A|nr:M23 family metallopeptidase [Pelagibacterium montanilacus]
MNAAHRNRQTALLKATGFEDSPALTVTSSEGELPQGREISLTWLAGTVLTGLTSFMLMAAAIHVSFKGQDTFSTPYDALAVQVPERSVSVADSLMVKSRRAKPVTETHSDLEIIEASIREVVEGVAHIRNRPFTLIDASLATSATALSEDIPAYDPVALLARNETMRAEQTADLVSTDIYGADVGGEVTIRTAALSLDTPPRRTINDTNAARFLRTSVEGAYADDTSPVLGYASIGTVGGLRELGVESGAPATVLEAENVTIVPRTSMDESANMARTERIQTIREQTPLGEALVRNGFTQAMAEAVIRAMRNVHPETSLSPGARLRILFGPNRGTETLLPQRLSIYQDTTHRVTVALADRGQYVMALEPPRIDFSEVDTEEVNLSNLPSIYRSIWETGRKHNLDDAVIDRIAAMFAYDVDLTRRIAPGDSIAILMSDTPESEDRELLYVNLKLGNTERELFRYHTEDGVIDFYNPDGETGKQFLLRRPLEGGGNMRSRYGYRRHPVFGDYRLHAGVDFAARTGTPIYAAGDGVIERAQWFSGYGRYVEVRHANGYATAYAHMSAIEDGITPGTRVNQGEVIGYVGSTGLSTGPHLHYEMKINGNTVDPMAVKLPRANSLAAQHRADFENTVAQIRALVNRENDPSPVTVASN